MRLLTFCLQKKKKKGIDFLSDNHEIAHRKAQKSIDTKQRICYNI